MYQCFIPPRIFLAVGVGLLIFSLVLGWISFSVPDWLQYYERNTARNLSDGNPIVDENDFDQRKFGLWYKCFFSNKSNDFVCTSWKEDAPSFVRVAQVLIPFGLILGCLSLLSAMIGLLSRRTLVTAVLFAALFVFLNFIFTTIGVAVFATESLVYVERLRLNNNDNCRRWGMWLLVPNIVLSLLSSICFLLASALNWCDYQSMQVTGILSHAAEKYGDSVFKARSDSNMTTTTKKRQSYNHQPGMPSQDYPNACYQLSGSHSNGQPMGYPPPPSYAGPIHQHGNAGGPNSGYPPASGMCGFSRAASPMFPHSNFDSYHHRHYITENSELEDFPTMRHSRHRSRSRRHSSHRSRSHSPRDNPSQESHAKQPQFIPIPIPYYQPAPSAPAPINNASSQMNNSNTHQPMPYMIQQPRQQYIEEMIQPTAAKTTNMIAYNPGQPSLLLSNPTQPVYTIAYRANNGGSVLTSNILSGPAAATYVTAPRRPKGAEVTLPNYDNDHEDQDRPIVPRQTYLKKVNANETWAWRKL